MTFLFIDDRQGAKSTKEEVFFILIIPFKLISLGALGILAVQVFFQQKTPPFGRVGILHVDDARPTDGSGC